MSIEAMKQALEALDWMTNDFAPNPKIPFKEIAKALRTAIEEAAQPAPVQDCPHGADSACKECYTSQPAPAQEPPPECQTEAEKRAYAFGWWKAMEANRAAQTRPATREEKIVNPGVYEILDTEARYKDVIEATRKVWNDHRIKRAEESFESAKQREWIGLTLDEQVDLFAATDDAYDFYHAIEAKLKEKNHHG